MPLGGHNLLEPAALHCAVLAGPHTRKAATAYEAILAAPGLRRVTSSADIAREARAACWPMPKAAAAAGDAAARGAATLVGRGGPTVAQLKQAPMRAPDFWRAAAIPGPATLLAPLGALYGAAWRLRRDAPALSTPRLPVICVGNLTAGGSGKTPVAIAIAERCLARPQPPFFLTRGYGGSERGPALAMRAHSAAQMGDEPCCWRHAPTMVARDRAAGAKAAAAAGAGLIILDDEFREFPSSPRIWPS